MLFVVGQINYGGRVTDDWDRRCLMAILSVFLNPGILDKEYSFSESGTYKIPTDDDMSLVKSYAKYCEGLPLSEEPEVFGMHDNANISFLTQEAARMLNVVLEIQPREAGGGGGKTPKKKNQTMS